MGRPTKFITLERRSVEASGYSAAAEMLLIGLKHLKKHRVSYPNNFASFEDWEKVVDELIWYLEFVIRNELSEDRAERDRADKAAILLGKHFESIWC